MTGKFWLKSESFCQQSKKSRVCLSHMSCPICHLYTSIRHNGGKKAFFRRFQLYFEVCNVLHVSSCRSLMTLSWMYKKRHAGKAEGCSRPDFVDYCTKKNTTFIILLSDLDETGSWKYSLLFPLLPSGCSTWSISGQIALLVGKVSANRPTDNKQLLSYHLQTEGVRGFRELSFMVDRYW